MTSMTARHPSPRSSPGAGAPSPEAGPVLDRLRDPSWMAGGSADQRRAWAVLTECRPMQRMAPWPVRLAGTWPLDLGIRGSDLDLLVEVPDVDAAAARLDELFWREEGYHRRRGVFAHGPAVTASFTCDGMDVEVFAQAHPVERQLGWLHLVAEARLLEARPDAGEAVREAVREAKRQGMKTEPAFAHIFAIDGDAYAELARLADAEDSEINMLAANFGI